MNPSRLSRRPPVALCAALALTAAPGPPAAAQPAEGRIIATPVRDFQIAGEQPLSMPTAVAVADDGRVFAADGVNDRIVAFNPDGQVTETITAAGSATLSNPVSVKVDSRSHLWIADTGNRRIVVRDTRGELHRTIPIPAEGTRHAPEITDLLLWHDESRLWIIDNDNHRVALFDLALGAFTTIVPRAGAESPFRFPFMGAVADNNRLYVSDVTHGRVRSILPPATLGNTIGSYGVEPGQLYRPKGVACDEDGNVWVSDGVLGVIQVFTPRGAFLGIVRAEGGEVLRLTTPCGLAVRGDRLYVVESVPGRVRKFRFRIEAPQEAPPAQRRPEPVPRPDQPQQCTVCHVEWMPPFAQNRGTELMDRPPTSRESPFVSRSSMCFSCHDGSVVDSRRRVWIEHGHATGIATPQTMAVPADLPLVNGRIACRTCHSAHTHGGSGQSMFDAVFLRVEHSPDELCVRCHTDMKGTESFAAHPATELAAPLPKALVDAGARLGPAPHKTGCMVCHAAHGGAGDFLFVPAAGLSSLCSSCHDGGHTQRPLPAASAHHPLGAESTSFHVASFAADPDELNCASCHAMHKAPAATSLLRAHPNDSQLCLGCHADYDSLIGSTHDLRHSAPEATNLTGATAEAGGPCSACHNVHTPARDRPADPFDFSGRCVTCHQAGRCAENVAPRTVSHPVNVPIDPLTARLLQGAYGKTNEVEQRLTCVHCHDPHDGAQTRYLRSEPDRLCATCHAGYDALASGGHDFYRHPDVENARGRTAAQTGRCGFCHAVHDASGPALWAATDPPPQTADHFCTDCHRSDYPTFDRDPAPPLHPKLTLELEMLTDMDHPLPLFDESAIRNAAGAVSCPTCHDPHTAARASPSLLRITANDEPAPLCTNCHTEAAAIADSFHAPAYMTDYAGASAQCGPCHVTHGESTLAGTRMWTGPSGSTSLPAGTRTCTGCHGPGGGQDEVAFWRHPTLPQFRTEAFDTSTRFPLVDHPDTDPHAPLIGCVTCHLPHGQPLPSANIPLDPGADSAPLLHAAKPMLRPYTAPNLCSSCHGVEGLQYFLHFHDRVEKGSQSASP